MQGVVDALGQGPIHALDPGDFLDAGAAQPGQAAEVLEQGRPPARADARDVLQPAGLARLLPLAAVAGDGEAVCFVAHLLDQLQAGRGGSRPPGRTRASWPARRSSPLATPTMFTPVTPRSSSTACAWASWPAPPSISSRSGSTPSSMPRRKRRCRAWCMAA